MAFRIPHLLEPYLSLPPECSLTLISGVLGASTNWVVLRYLYSALSRKLPGVSPDEELASGKAETDTAVVLVSFMRDFAFWRDGISKLGIDLEGLTRNGKFVFVDGLSGLIVPYNVQPQKGRRMISSPQLREVQKQLEGAISDVSAEGRKVMLVLDQPDAFLAVTSGQTTELSLGDMILDLREKVHAAIITLMADEPLMETQSTTLEKTHASFALSMAHEAEMVVSLRKLDTGTANDVSGVVRVTRGGADSGRDIEAHEYLYFVGTDGSARVFERGQ